MTFSDQLRNERKSLGLTQAGAAALLDVSRDTVAAWESERNTPIDVTQEGVLARLRATKKRPKAKGQNTGVSGPCPPDAAQLQHKLSGG